MSSALTVVQRNVGWKLAGTVADKGLRLLLVIVATRALGDALYGRFAYVAATTALFAQVTDLGTALFLTRETARRGSLDPALVGGLLALRRWLGLGYLLAVCALAFVHRDEPWLALALVGAGVGALGQSSLEACWAVFRGVQRLQLEARSQALHSALFAGSGLLVVALLALGLLPRDDRAIFALTLAAVAAVAVALWLAAQAALGLVRPSGHFDATLRARWLREGLPIGLAIMASMVYFKLDVPMLRWLRGDAETGSYAAAFRLLEMAAIAPAVLMSAAFPALAEAVVRDRAAARALHRKALLALAALGAGLALAVGLGAEVWIALLYGPSFAASVEPLQALAPALFLSYINYLETHMLIALGAVRWQLLLSVLLCGANLALNAAWIPTMGARGAALATVATELLLLLGAMPLVARALHTEPTP